MSGQEDSLSFLDLEQGQCPLAESHRNIIKSLVKPSELPLPGEIGVWETPKRRSPECEFGEATAILKELKLNPHAAVFEFPSPTNSVGGTSGGERGEDGPVIVSGIPGQNEMDKPPLVRKLSASSAPFVPNIPIPSFPTSHTQTIHINNLTANVNYHVQPATPPSSTTATASSGGKSMPVPPSAAVPSAVPSGQFPFTVNGAYINHYPNQHMNYQPPLVVYQDPNINMFYPQQQSQQTTDKNGQVSKDPQEQKYTGPPVVSVKEKLAAADDEMSPPSTATANVHPQQQQLNNSSANVNNNNNTLPPQHKLHAQQPGVNTMIQQQQPQQQPQQPQQQTSLQSRDHPPPPFGNNSQKPAAVAPTAAQFPQSSHPHHHPQVVVQPRDFAAAAATAPFQQQQQQQTTKPPTMRDVVAASAAASPPRELVVTSSSTADVVVEQQQHVVTFGDDAEVVRPPPAASAAAVQVAAAARIEAESEKAAAAAVMPTSNFSDNKTSAATDLKQSATAGRLPEALTGGFEVYKETPEATSTPATPQPEVQQVKTTTTWASLFKSDSASKQVSTDKPMAMIPPFTAVAASSGSLGAAASPTPPQVPQDIADTKARKFGEFLLSYELNHHSTSLLPAGLSNRSNWCFVNAVLQALVACPPFYNLFKHINVNIGVQGLVGTKTAKVQAILGFIKEFSPLETIVKPQKKEKMRKKEDIRTGACFEPTSVYKMLLSLPPKDTFQVVEGRQEDAEEFLTCILNGLSDEMTDIIKMVPKQQGTDHQGPPDMEEEDEGDDDADDWKEVNSKGRHCVTRRVVNQEATSGTPIQSLALGMCRSIVRCGSGEISATLQPFYTLQLDIQHPEVDSLNQALLKNFDQEEIEGYKNQKTNQIVKATRSLNLEELPRILILHMKRFVYDVNTGGVQKTLKPVQFSVDLEIPKNILSNETRSKFSQRQRQYKLFAVVCHYGKEATKGHYVTDVYHTGYGCWLHCDDGTVTETAEESVLTPSQNSTPYILFYRRCDTVIGQEKKENKTPK